jgi:NDP-sugar pyrophosphorylase family protein
MEYLLDRMQAAGCTEIRVVTRPDKQDVVELARSRGAAVVLGRPSSVSESLAAGVAGVAPDTAVVFGFPDTLWGPADGFTRLLAALDADVAAVLALFRTEEPARSDVVEVDGDGRVLRIEVKPQRPRSDLVWGCAACPAGVVQAFLGDAEPGAYLHGLAARGLVRGVRLCDPFVDIGTPESLRRLAAEPTTG